MEHPENNIEMAAEAPTKTNKVLIKLIIIAALVLGLLIPLIFINNLIQERAARQENVTEEVSNKWATQQTIAGPYLSIPYTVQLRNAEGEVYTEERFVYIMPQDLKINGELQNETRKRSLYKVNLYQASCKIEGKFTDIDWNKLNINKNHLHWNRARINIGLTDVAGLTNEVNILWGNNKLQTESYNNEANIATTGVNALLQTGDQYANTFSFELNFKGSTSINFVPMGNNTAVKLTSNFPHPSFSGKLLPSTPNANSSKGFDAAWKTITTQRSFPQAWAGKKVNIEQDAFGVRLVETANAYIKTERVVKYALLFICLTFGVFFLIETMQKLQLHPLQYILVGFAILIFYVLLLSFSEFIGFNWAYVISSIAVVILVSSYIASIVKKKKIAIGFLVGLSALYAYVYFLIQLEDMALIFGSIALFALLGLIMFLTRNINWYKVQSNKLSDASHT